MVRSRIISGFITNNRSSPAFQTGVTLIELLVALSILGFAAGLVVLNAPPARPAAKSLAEEMASRLVAAKDASILTGASHRLEFAGSDYRITRYAGRDEWVSISNWRGLPEQGVVLSMTKNDISKDNALALNGGSNEPETAQLFDDFVLTNDKESTKESKRDGITEYFVIDPLTATNAFEARIEGERTVWTVKYSAVGDVTIVGQ
ncbi:MAG: prepilin-type N-terminal cleavage/methylation domain-containing protein [Pseudomonadota bacterium]